MFAEVCVGLVFAAAIAAAAHRLRALTLTGAIAAAAVGALIFVAGGIAWSVLLLAFFVTSSALSRIPRGDDGLIAKGGRRDAAQVLANGGIPALVALAAILLPGHNWLVPYAGALAAATADTWATEVGRLSRTPPRHVTTGRRVRPGTSGGVTPLGVGASVAGASVLAGVAALAGLGSQAIWVALAGTFGSLLDSILGATLQEIRRCPVCLETTEQIYHVPCGTRTIVIGGVRGLNNDGVNALTAISSALMATVLFALAGRT